MLYYSLHCTHRLHCCWLLALHVVCAVSPTDHGLSMVWLLWAVCSNISVVVLSLLSIIQHHLTVLWYWTNLLYGFILFNSNGIASFPRSRGKYFRKLFRIRLRRIEWQALRGWLRSAFWTYLSAEYLFPTSDCELQCVGRLPDGIALYSVRFYAVHFTNENSNQIPQ